jgi:hypothetical protein
MIALWYVASLLCAIGLALFMLSFILWLSVRRERKELSQEGVSLQASYERAELKEKSASNRRKEVLSAIEEFEKIKAAELAKLKPMVFYEKPYPEDSPELLEAVWNLYQNRALMQIVGDLKSQIMRTMVDSHDMVKPELAQSLVATLKGVEMVVDQIKAGHDAYVMIRNERGSNG